MEFKSLTEPAALKARIPPVLPSQAWVVRIESEIVTLLKCQIWTIWAFELSKYEFSKGDSNIKYGEENGKNK